MLRSQMLGDFVIELYSQKALNDCFRVYEKYIQLLDFDGVSYTFIPQIQSDIQAQNSPIFLSSELFPDSFIEQYVDERFDQHDFTIREIESGSMSPMDWQECWRSDSLSNEEKNVLYLAKEEHGIKNGISLPTQSDNIGLAGAGIISSANDRDFQKIKIENLQLLRQGTKVFHEHLIANPKLHMSDMFILPLLGKLKPKEIWVLEYIESGKSLKNIKNTYSETFA